MKTDIHIYKTPQALAEALAHDIFLNIMQTLKQQRYFSIALSGGNTPKLLFSVLSKGEFGAIPWDNVLLFWGDERCVPPDHPDSNFGMSSQYLLQNIVIPENNIFRIKGENEPAKEAERYSQVISEHLQVSNGLPVFDLVLLGLGEDGHTASIFPDQMEMLKSDLICEVAVHPENQQKRISLTAKVINKARSVIFLVTGASKASVVTSILNHHDQAEKYPAAHISPSQGELHWYLDEAAAEYHRDFSGK